MSEPRPSVTPKKDSATTPPFPPCTVPHRWTLHIGRCVSAYFDHDQPEASWTEHIQSDVQILYFGSGADCTVWWMHAEKWNRKDVRGSCVWVIGAGVPHKLEWRRPALRLALQVQTEFVAEFVGLEIVGSYLLRPETLDRCDQKILEFLRLFERLEQPRTVAESVHVESLASLISIHIFQAWACITNPGDAWTMALTGESLAKVNAFIDAHMDQKILLGDMAQEVGMSESNFTRHFKRRTGMTPGRYLIERRIQKSKTFLVEKNWTIGEIALAVGFSNQGHFHLFFKRQTGKSPREYRLSHRIGGIS